ncbi:MAG: trypsin-like peptidase domain-containing protein [candidate division Zixibacteria bacterium]|nr:trypsin-like peptidase domain-containing protein [candidate division Zixibacteria bacterium]
MKNLLSHRLPTILGVLLIIGCAVTQEAKAGESQYRCSVGKLYKKVNDTLLMRIGTGFVAGNQSHICTAAHVVMQDTLLFKLWGSTKYDSVVVKYLNPQHDLAVLETINDVQMPSLQFGDFDLLREGDSIIVVGWRTDKLLQAEIILIYSIGLATIGSTTVDYVAFMSNSIPGYSGGPVLNIEGKVIGIFKGQFEFIGTDSTAVKSEIALSIKPIIIYEDSLEE